VVLQPERAAAAKAWISQHGRRAAMIAGAVVVLAVAANVIGAKSKEASELKQLSYWGITKEDWSAVLTGDLFAKARLSERLGELRGAADRGEPIAQTIYATALDNGVGMDVNHDEAHAMFLAAAKKGEARAQYRLGEHFYSGDGVPAADQKEAFKWYKRSAVQGNALGEANVGYYYDAGLAGIKKDPKTAMKWYRRAADQGLASAQHNLANFIEFGTAGTKPDREEAARYYRLAADQGYPSSQQRLAYYYMMGWGGITQDQVEAEKLYRLAAQQGSGRAAVMLGWMYANGAGGLPRDDNLALYWCRQAVSATIDPAQADAQTCVNDALARLTPSFFPSQ
jgi:TPR repeat protein